MVHCKISCPSRKPFIQPQFRPVLHGDQVTEPLMGQFVSNNIGCFILDSVIALPLFEQNFGWFVDNYSPVFHCSGDKIMGNEMIRLGKGIVYPKDICEKVQHFASIVQCELTMGKQTRRGIKSDRNMLPEMLAFGESLDVLEFAYTPTK
jgi:hypothetical protein